MEEKTELELVQIIVEAINCIKKKKYSKMSINLDYIDANVNFNDSSGKAALKRTDLTKAIL
jgi:transcriptional regulator of NAD metabolism